MGPPAEMQNHMTQKQQMFMQQMQVAVSQIAAEPANLRRKTDAAAPAAASAAQSFSSSADTRTVDNPQLFNLRAQDGQQTEPVGEISSSSVISEILQARTAAMSAATRTVVGFVQLQCSITVQRQLINSFMLFTAANMSKSVASGF